MSHFNYELNESNLRIQLRNLEMPAGEDAWQKFEKYSESQPGRKSENKFNFRIMVNRNVLLPAVFGVVIVSFSLILFNFISIKGPKRVESGAKAETSVSVVPEGISTQMAKEEPKPLIVEPQTETASQTLAEQPKEIQTQPAQQYQTLPKPVAKEEPIQAAQAPTTTPPAPEQTEPVIAQTPAETPTSPVNGNTNSSDASLQASGDNSLNSVIGVQPTKNKGVKRGENNKQLLDIRPSVVTEDSDPEVRPN